MERLFAPRAVPPGQKKGSAEQASTEALGRSRGGLTTKIHLLCDSHGHPLEACLSPGQSHESQYLDELLDNCDVTGYDWEIVVYPAALAGDKGYRADWIDADLLNRGIRPVIPSKENEDRDARPVQFDREQYRQRNIVERLIGWLKESRRILTRFEKRARNFLGMIKWAFIQRYLRLMCEGSSA
jgi:transposase